MILSRKHLAKTLNPIVNAPNHSVLRLGDFIWSSILSCYSFDVAGWWNRGEPPSLCWPSDGSCLSRDGAVFLDHGLNFLHSAYTLSGESLSSQISGDFVAIWALTRYAFQRMTIVRNFGLLSRLISGILL